jgi:hypothetical protein
MDNSKMANHNKKKAASLTSIYTCLYLGSKKEIFAIDKVLMTFKTIFFAVKIEILL